LKEKGKNLVFVCLFGFQTVPKLKLNYQTKQFQFMIGYLRINDIIKQVIHTSEN
jgi:hypothetical protein